MFKLPLPDHEMTADEFQAALDRLGWPQRQFANQLGLSISTVNRWARDRHGQRPPRHIQALLVLVEEHDRLLRQIGALAPTPP